MRNDTRTLLKSGSIIFTCGVLGAALAEWVCGGIGRHGPHTNAGWFCLMIAMGCLPTGFLTLVLALSKLYGDQHRED